MAQLIAGPSPADVSTSWLARMPSLAGGALNLFGKVRGSVGDIDSQLHLLAQLGGLKGVAMKLGQHLSYVDSPLHHEVRATLGGLQTHSPPLATPRVAAIVRAELGDAAAPLVKTLEPTPIASASIGQVHRAQLPDGTPVVVKVRYPRIARAIKADFGPASLVGQFATWLYPHSRIKGFVREAKARALAECDYRAEARHAAELAARFADHSTIAIPAVHAAYCTDRVIATTFVDGRHLWDWLTDDPSLAARTAIGEALVEFYVATALRWNLLPGDPHPGNFVVLPGNRLAIVDHGSMLAELTPAMARVLEAPDVHAADHAARSLGAQALLPLRVRLGVASLLGQLGVQPSWREILATVMAPGPTRFDIVLVAPGERIIEMVREVRALTGGNITTAKQLLDQTPRVVTTTATRREAEALKRRLETSGGVVEIRAS